MPTGQTRSNLIDQAEIAERYAAARPAADIKGYVQAVFDARRFRAEAELLA